MKSLRQRLTRRGLVRVISFATALVVVLAASSITAFAMARSYRTTIEYTYQRALSDLVEYINSLDISLDKGKYATTQKQTQGLAAKLWQDAGNAKNALAQLPVTNESTEATSKFLSQVGNYCVALAGQSAEGREVTDEDLKKLDQLAGYAAEVAEKLRQMQQDVQSGKLHLGEVSKAVKKDDTGENAPNVNNGFKEISQGFADYPTMIYDGPFSDNIQQQKPKFLEGRDEASQDDALKAARDATGNAALAYQSETAGNLPCYTFTADSLTVSVAKAGGMVEYFLNSRGVDERTLSDEDAVGRAEQALRDFGFDQFRYRYYAVNSGVLTVNFAATQDGAVLYPDLIKVGVALDNGEIVSYDAKGYLMNHTQRTLPQARLTEAEARAVLSPRLAPESQSMAVIPTDGLNEVYCYEYFCKGEEGEQVLVYINAETGMEEDILIIIEDETGVLSM